MTWEEYLKELIHTQMNSNGSGLYYVWIGPWRLDINHTDLVDVNRLREEVIERISIVVRKAVGAALHVLPHEDPPMSDKQIETWRHCGETSTHKIKAEGVLELVRMIDWQKARIAHMATDNGYNDGVEAGKAAWNKENYEWIEALEYSGQDTAGYPECPECRWVYPGGHADHCRLGNYLRDNKPKS